MALLVDARGNTHVREPALVIETMLAVASPMPVPPASRFHSARTIERADARAKRYRGVQRPLLWEEQGKIAQACLKNLFTPGCYQRPDANSARSRERGITIQPAPRRMRSMATCWHS